MPRQARLDAPGTLHHVMIRGIEGIPIFRDDDDLKDFLFRVGKLAEKTQTWILAWTLLDNHVHLLLFSGPKGISTFMRRLLTGYSIRFNRKHQRSGYLFQNCYKSIVCQEEPCFKVDSNVSSYKIDCHSSMRCPSGSKRLNTLAFHACVMIAVGSNPIFIMYSRTASIFHQLLFYFTPEA